MSTTETKQRKPLVSNDRTRLLSARMMMSALKFENVRNSDLFDNDEPLAAVLGPWRHARLCAEMAKDDTPDEDSGRLNNVSTNLRSMALSHLQSFEKKLIAKTQRQQDHLSDNVSRLGRMLGLNRAENRIIEFTARMVLDCDLAEAANAFDKLTTLNFFKVLARITQCRRASIRAALSENSRLVQSGVLELGSGFRHQPMHGMDGCGFNDLELLSGLAESLVSDTFDFDRIFTPFFRRSKQPELKIADFEYLGDVVEVLRALFDGAARQRENVVQVLLYGAPGTGKTQLAHALAHAVGASLYSVSTGTALGKPHDRDQRFRCFRLAQQALKSRRNKLLLFDEIEDVLPERPGLFGMFGENRRQKGWINELLEASSVPGIWIANSTQGIDPAYLRRFSLVVEIDRPPRSVRRLISAEYLQEFDVDESLHTRVADAQNVTPADLERTRRALRVSGNARKANARTATQTAATLLGSGSSGAGPSAFLPTATWSLPEFDPALINTDLDHDTIVTGLAKSGEGRLCFYGPPGTGKTTFAAYLSEKLDRELITVSASDWLDPYVGVTEQKIRRSFDHAQRANAVLFIDEADSFLRDRGLADRSWETTRVNELLKRLEQARGVVIFATNAFDVLDPSVLRRLDIKAAFRPLSQDQTETMFERTLAANGWDTSRDSGTAIKQIRMLTGLVNGDFAAACRRLQVSGQTVTPDGLVEALADEVNLRSRHHGAGIGFAAELG